jgi:ribonucleoside-diphosphate reductase alpha subunit
MFLKMANRLDVCATISALDELCFGLDFEYLKLPKIVDKLLKDVNLNIAGEELILHAADIAASMIYLHPDYATLAGRLLVKKIHKEVPDDFFQVTTNLYEANLISETYFENVKKHIELINELIDYNFDYNYKYFAVKTLENGYLLKINNVICERPQQMLMRVALAIHLDDIQQAIKSYKLMSEGMFIHASPTMFAAGSKFQQLSSCYLLTIKDDSVLGIYSTLGECAMISKHGGGLGLNVHKIRARGSYVKSINGTANGLDVMIRVFNNMVRHIDQGGRRKGALAIYLEPWHADIYAVLNLKRNMGSEDLKARDIMLALWVPDLFMERVHSNGRWSLMSPDQCPGLDECYSKDFERLYCNYEREGRFVRQVMARDLHRFIIETQVETGVPYILYKDSCNQKSNQRNLGTIKCSNLCAEIIQYSSPEETSVCNLASIAVNRFIKNKKFDFNLLKDVTKIVVQNLNKIININCYPLESTKRSNLKHMPVGVGIQGLADAFVMLKYPYESQEAKLLNKQIAETIYYGALEASCELAQKYGVYESYNNSPTSFGLLQYDLWNVEPSSLWNWNLLKKQIKLHGLRNSLLVAYMPTATTAQILGNNESFEPFTSNIYLRRVLSGEFQVINQYLIKDLIAANLYTDEIRKKIFANNGSVQNINEIPENIKDLYKTVWEMKNKNLIDMAADRAPFIDQSQSLNIFIAKPTYAIMSSIHYYGWRRGLKTGMYYLRTKPAANAQQFTVEACARMGNECTSCES